jgi:hypothetical protein
VKIFDLTNSRILVTRDSARAIGSSIRSVLSEGEAELDLDFSGVTGVTPSFLDEVLAVIEEEMAHSSKLVEIRVLNPPTRLSSKFKAVGRGRGFSIRQTDDKTWLILKEDSGS